MLSFRQIMPKCQRGIAIAGGAVCMLACPAAAWADAGIPMLPVRYPEILLFLVPVILIEAFYLHNTLRSKWRRTLAAVCGVNVLTMALGYPLAWLLYVWLDRLLNFPAATTGIFSHLAWLPVWICTRLMPEWGGVQQEIWPVMVMFILLLIPSYLVSGAVKAALVDLYDLLHSRGSSRHEVWMANRLSYLFLAGAGCVLLYNMYSSPISELFSR